MGIARANRLPFNNAAILILGSAEPQREIDSYPVPRGGGSEIGNNVACILNFFRLDVLIPSVMHPGGADEDRIVRRYLIVVLLADHACRAVVISRIVLMS